jgi:two-component sensor histidine kinase
MSGKDKGKADLSSELADLRRRVAELEAAEAEHKRAKQALEKRNQELALLNRAGRTFVATLDLDEVIETVFKEVQQLLGAVAYSIWLVQPGAQELVCRQASGPRSEIVHGWQLEQGAGIAGWVAHHGESLIVPDTRLDTRHFKEIDRKIQLEIRSMLSVPLKLKGRVVGVLQMVDTTANRFGQSDLELLEALAATAAIAIENAQLYDQARRDAQTKLTLLHEVNHRVKNNLATIVGLLYADRRRAGVREETAYQDILNGMIGRIQGLATVHKLLSAAEWRLLPLSELAGQIIRTALRALPPQQTVTVDISPSPIQVSPKQANYLALIINELTNNSLKYALAGRSEARLAVRIRLEDEPGRDEPLVVFEFRDDGPAYPEEVLQLRRSQVGLYLVQTMVQNDLNGELSLYNEGGAVTVIRFRCTEEGAQYGQSRENAGADRRG